MTSIESLQENLKTSPRTWLVTGVAGFIGSNLLEALLKLGQRVVGLDNFSTGRRTNLDQVKQAVGDEAWQQFKMIEGDICDSELCRRCCSGADYVLHQAALGSVPRSVALPADSHAANVTGTVNMLVAARDARVRRMVYASSSSVYGDDPHLPKREEQIGRPLSPYAATKLMDEIYADIFSRCYELECIGLRYFNVFGPRQDPDGPYAAVIPRWIVALIRNEAIYINGDGATSRDFCYVQNVVQANLLAAATANSAALNQAYNVAVGARTTLNELFHVLQSRLGQWYSHVKETKPVYRNFREGDVRHSEADISKARKLLGYQPTHTMSQGMDEALNWYRKHLV